MLFCKHVYYSSYESKWAESDMRDIRIRKRLIMSVTSIILFIDLRINRLNSLNEMRKVSLYQFFNYSINIWRVWMLYFHNTLKLFMVSLNLNILWSIRNWSNARHCEEEHCHPDTRRFRSRFYLDMLLITSWLRKGGSRMQDYLCHLCPI